MKLIIFIAFIFSLSNCQWTLYKEYFKGGIPQSDLNDWTASRNTNGFIQNCGETPIVGGRHKFGHKIEFYNTFTNLPAHSRVRVKLTLWQIDTWDHDTRWGYDNWHVFIDEQRVHVEYKEEGAVGGSQICGSGYGDIIQPVDFEVTHNKNDLKLLFTDTFNEDVSNESWGLTNLEIYLYQECTDGTMYGDVCLTDEQFIKCYNQLQEIDAQIANNCEAIYLGEELAYKMTISYENGFELDTSCFTQKVDFEDTYLTKSAGIVDQWSFNSDSQEITFNIFHKDLETKYNCEKISDNRQYLWVCDTSLHILFSGKRQLKYSFQLQISVLKTQSKEIKLNVMENVLIGNCCENELQIATALRFCTDLTCEEHLDSPLTVKRNEDIFIEHYISTKEFQDYYLHGLYLKLGPVVPTIINRNTSKRGSIIYQIQSHISLDDITIECVSRLDEQPQPQNTRLLIQDVGDDYKVKANGQLTVLEEDSSKKNIQQDQPQEKQSGGDKIILYAFIGVCGLLLVTGAAFLKHRHSAKKREKALTERYIQRGSSVSQLQSDQQIKFPSEQQIQKI